MRDRGLGFWVQGLGMLPAKNGESGGQVSGQ